MTISGDRANLRRELGARLRVARETADLSRRQVEERTGGIISAAAIGTYEHGIRPLTVENLVALARVYRLPAEMFVSALSVDAEDQPVIVVDPDSTVLKALSLYPEATGAGQRRTSGRGLALTRHQIEQLAILYRTTPETILQRLKPTDGPA